ncbi:MAG TPA: HAMP domain-containing sensor histidine kinase, partial [Planctomycetota bacterium]|nr:HAMP domain-containing sensor histidine kinase [Planctomycetota bacterium]
IAVAWHGSAALDLDAYLPWSGAAYPRKPIPMVVPCLGALPLLLLSYSAARSDRALRSSRWFLWSVFTFALLKVLPSGVVSPGWFLQPLLVVIAAVAFGPWSGLAMAGAAAAGLGLCAWTQETYVFDYSPSAFAVPVIGILLGGGMLGALLHRTLQGLFAVEVEQRERIEQTLRALRQRENLLRHAMRVATIGEMASMVVHQLRNKFQLVQGHVGLGLAAEPAEKDRRLREIESVVRCASTVVERLLTLAHPGQSAPRVVDLVPECRRLADWLSGGLLPHSIRLETEFPAAAYAFVSPDDFCDAMMNLLVNAKQAMHRGTIRIVVRTTADQGTIVTVADDGPGLAEHVRLHLFTPFVTTKPRGTGTGLGLFAVNRFVRASGGHIEVETEPGQGTAFHMHFPAVPSERRHARVG